MTLSSTLSVPLAITGIGCLFPGARGLREYWSRIVRGVDSITEVPPSHWRPDDYFHPDPKAPDRVYAYRGGFLEPVPFPPAEYGIAPNNLEATDTAQLLGLLVAREALEDAGYDLGLSAERGAAGRVLDRSRVSVILGVTGTLELVIPLGARLGHPLWRRALREAGVADDVAESVVQRIADGYVGWQESSFPGLLGNVVAGRIANRFDLGGTNCVVDAACASSLSALHLAALELTTGRADVVLTGGVDTFNDIFMYMCFSKTPALSPTGDARPFDAAADGTVLGEGIGMVVLKRLDHARRDGDRIYAVVRGIGTASDGRGNAVYAPKAAGQVECLRDAYQVAGVSPDTVELVEAHGTGTKVGDATEAAALAEVYRATGREGTWCALGSVKSQIGHTKAAAGVAGLIKAAAALHHKVLPPTIKVQQPLDALLPGRSPFYVSTEPRPWMAADHPRRAAVSAFGFGGSNFHCVLEEADPRKSGIDWDGKVQIIALAGADPGSLRSQLDSLPGEIDWDALRRHAAATRQDWKAALPWRLLLVVERGRTEVAHLRQQALALIDQPQTRMVRPPEGVFFGNTPTVGKLAVVFPGQGAQYVGMLRDLACRFPHLHESLARADGVWREARGGADGRLSDRIYPFPAFAAEDRAAQESVLRDTATAQPALAGVCLGGWRILESFGVRADFAAGHSFGELLALCVGGRLTAEELLTLSLLRGRLMADAGRGGMLAVAASMEEVDALLREARLDLVVANHNTPQQVVVSGRVDEIDKAEALWTAKRTTVRRLAVSSAFHSRLVSAAAHPLREALEHIAMPVGSVPVFANTTAAAYPADAAEARVLLAEQLAHPVRWVDEIENLYAADVRTFLEVGPGRRVCGMIDAILREREHASVAIDGSAGQRSGTFDLACCLAELAARGHPIDLRGWDDSPLVPAPPDGKRSLVVSLCGANYVKPKPAQPPAARVVESHPAKNGTPQATMNGPPAPSEPAAARGGASPATSSAIAATSPPVAPPASSAAVVQALQVTRESLVSLQRMQEQTAALHRQFLEGQEAAHRTVQLLVEQQQRLLQAALGPASLPATIALPPLPLPAPHSAGEVPVPRTATLSAPPPAPRSSPRAEAVLLEVVSEKTGYPADMLDLEMALDTDLGIDSIKRVEILSALQERLPEAPVVRPEHLGTLHTLREVADFLGAAPSNGTPRIEERELISLPAPSTKALAQPRSDQVARVLVEVVSEKTGYPADMLDLEMALDTDLGIDSIKRVEILSALQERLPEAPVVRPEHLGTLHTLRQVADFLSERSGPTGTAAPAQTQSIPPPPTSEVAPASGLTRLALQVIDLDEAAPRSAVRLAAGSEVWIAAEEETPLAGAIGQRLAAMGLRPIVATCAALGLRRPQVSLAGLVLLASLVAADDALLRDGLQVLRMVADALRAAARDGGAVVLTVSRMDGSFGLVHLATSRPPIDGGLAGMAKTAAREWPEVSCKAVDVSGDFLSVEEAAAAVVEEMFLAGPLEVGVSPRGRRTLQLVEGPAAVPVDGARFAPGEGIVLSGGARGVTAEAAVALARRFQSTLVLLGRSAVPQDEPPWLAPWTSEAEIKRELVRQGRGGSLKEIGEHYREIVAAREVRQTLQGIEAAGGRALYRSVDVRDAAAVADVMAAVRREVGPIRGLVHGAGVLADARIEDKTTEQFDRVYQTKVGGLRNLLACLGPDELRALVLFSSSTARFGRVGQVDYAIANEVLNKLAQREALLRPACRVVAINWGPWDGGMVTSGLKKLFESENVGLISPDEGGRFLVQELQRGSGDVEVVVLAGAPSATQARSASDGTSSQFLSPSAGTQARSNGLKSVLHASDGPSSLVPGGQLLPLAFERVLHRADHPVLESHQLDGRPVVPVALLLEWLAHAALHHNPGLIFHGCQTIRIFQGIVLSPNVPVTLRFGAGKAQRSDGLHKAAVEVHGRRPDGRDVLHARADVLLAGALLPPAPSDDEVPAAPPYPRPVAEVYRDLLFHGRDLHGLRRIDGFGPAGIIAHANAAPAPQTWITRPLRQKWLADPLVLDVSFQLMVLWSLEQRGAGSLPCAIHDYRQYRRSFPADGAQLVIHIRRVTEGSALADIDYRDGGGALIAQVRGYECVIDPGLERAFGRKAPAAVVP